MPATGATDHHLTDLGNAGRFADRNADRVCYCYTRASWLVWDGCRWAADDSGRVEELAPEIVRSIYGEAGRPSYGSSSGRKPRLGGCGQKRKAGFRRRRRPTLRVNE